MRIQKNIVILIIGMLLSSHNVHAQKLKTLIKSGDEAFANKDYFGASIYYNKAILKDSSDIDLQYKYAEACRLNYDFGEANRWYNKVYKQDKQGKLYPECVFWIGTLSKGKGNYKEAIGLFNKYIKKNKKNKNSFLYKKAEQEVASCVYAQWLVSHPDSSITIIHLDSSVNSTVSEYAPFQVDSMLYFSSLRDDANRDEKNKINYNKLYSSKQHDMSFEKSLELDTLYNRENIHNANTTFNDAHNKVYISRCQQLSARDFRCEIYSSEYGHGGWGTPEKLPAEINMEGYNNTQPALGLLNGEEVLFFASDRPGGEGGMDIWYSKINTDGTYGKPINAGKKVNSMEDEKTPFFCKPCQELFFSSTWHKGLGGYDVFKSAYDGNAFSEPQNLGLPINSPYNDVYFSINTQKTQAFFSSNRVGSFFEEKETCCNDIYMFKIPGTEEQDSTNSEMDSVELAKTQLKLLVPLTLYFHNDQPDSKTLATTTKKNYKTTYDEYYALKGLYRGQFVKGAKAKDTERAKAAIEELFEDSITGGMRQLEAFAATLLPLLEKGEKVTITMKGYASPLASTNYNANLCKRRIYSVKNFFKEYENGVLQPYIDNNKQGEGNITFVEEEFGELQASKKVSDDYLDTRNSIYSPLAAYERKIQIIAISFPSSNE